MTTPTATTVTFPRAASTCPSGPAINPPQSVVTRVRDAMVTGPKTHGKDTPLEDIRSLFEDDHVHMALIVAHGRLITTVQRSDLIEPFPRSMPAYCLGTLVGRTISPNRPLDEVTAALNRSGKRRLAVTNGSGELLGLLCLKRDRSGYCSDDGIRHRATQSSAPNVDRATS
jgi:CBS domain-containing protein